MNGVSGGDLSILSREKRVGEILEALRHRHGRGRLQGEEGITAVVGVSGGGKKIVNGKIRF